MTALQAHVDTLRRGPAPFPLTDGQAIVHAVRLKKRGMTYEGISIVMGIYHGQWYAGHRWARACRARGVPPVNRGFGRTQPLIVKTGSGGEAEA